MKSKKNPAPKTRRSLLDAQKKYDETHTKRICLKLNLETDKDILERLDSVSAKQTYIKELIREDIKREQQNNE